MLGKTRNPKLALASRVALISLLVGISAGSAANVFAAPLSIASVRILGGNEVQPNQYYMTDVVPLAHDNTGNVATLNETTISFSGIDANSENATMTLTASGAAQSTSQGLKAKTAASLAGAFYNEANSPYVTNTSFNVDPDGIPTSFSIDASARYRDTLSVVGDQSLTHVQIELQIDGFAQGKFSPDNWVGGASASLNQIGPLNQFGGNVNRLFGTSFSENMTAYDSKVMSLLMPVVNGAVDFYFLLNAMVSFSLDWEKFSPGAELEAYYEGFTDFFSTVTFGQLSGYDSNGGRVALTSVTGSDGAQYEVANFETPPNPVPAPATLALLAWGLILLRMARRDKSSAGTGRMMGHA